MAERIVETDRQEVDRAFLARLLLGAQSEHEQRLVAVRLLRHDAAFRAEVAALMARFEMFDLDLVADYARVLREGSEVESRRRRILVEAFARAPDLEQLLREFTFVDVLQLGEVTRRLFSWSMAEMLLERSGRPGLSEHEARTSLNMALMVIDVVEILGAAERSAEHPGVVRDVRRRIMEASERWMPRA